jgi:hypothetical protein
MRMTIADSVAAVGISAPLDVSVKLPLTICPEFVSLIDVDTNQPSTEEKTLSNEKSIKAKHKRVKRDANDTDYLLLAILVLCLQHP